MEIKLMGATYVVRLAYALYVSPGQVVCLPTHDLVMAFAHNEDRADDKWEVAYQNTLTAHEIKWVGGALCFTDGERELYATPGQSLVVWTVKDC